MNEQDELGHDLWDFAHLARKLCEAWEDPSLRPQIETEREPIMDAIGKLATLLARAENAEFQQVMLWRQLLKSAKMATGVVP